MVHRKWSGVRIATGREKTEMKPRLYSVLIGLTLAALLFSACAQGGAQVATPTTTVEDKGAELANPASVYCEEQGYRVDMRTAEDGSQAGVCVFTDGSECDEWAFYRKECGPGTLPAGAAPEGQPAIDPQVQEKVTDAVRKVLAEQLKVEASSITVKSVEAKLWKDACLGLGDATEMCSSAITPGFLVVVTAGDQEYSFRTNEAASAIRQEK
jgi:putative hemolysin